MATTSKTRTLKAYVADLLKYPRWVIEREIDFTDCPYSGNYNAFLPQCTNCRFGRGCRWLNQQRTPEAEEASFDDLLEALGAAVEYLQSTRGEQVEEYADRRAWIREARRFLRTRRE